MRLLLVALLAGCAAPPPRRPSPAPAAPPASAAAAELDAPLGQGLAALDVPAQTPTTFNERTEMRAGWIVGWRQMISTSAIDDALGLAEAAGLDAVFVQVRIAGDAYYRSSIVPRAEALEGQPADFDPLAYALKRGHAKGLAVHAWINTGVVWRSSSTLPSDPRHIFVAHPDWILRDANGKLHFPDPARDPQPGYIEENYWANWNDPGFQKHLVAVVGELASRYPVDGVHFDFARYPARMGPRVVGVGYDAASIARFEKETGQKPAEHTRAWDEWRLAQVGRTLKACRDEIKRRRPKALVSAAVLAAWNLGYGRNSTAYRRWLNDGTLDFAVLMSYFKDRAQIRQSVINARETADSRRVVLGLYMPLLSPQAAAREIELSREQDLKGFSLFPLDGVDLKDPKPYLERLRALAVPPKDDARYAQREPLWNRVGVLDADRRSFSLRFFSRTGRTKVVVYPRGIASLRLAVNGASFKPIAVSTGSDVLQLDLTPWLNPESREVFNNHDFTLTASADGPPESYAEVFTVDYYERH